jgi:hypothetical protein
MIHGRGRAEDLARQSLHRSDMKLSLRWLAILALIGLATVGCQSEPTTACSDMTGCDSSLREGGASFGSSAEGRLDATATQVWPGRPATPPPLTPQEIAEACSKLAACVPETGSDDEQNQARADYLSTCVSTNPYEERAIPYGSNYFFATSASDFLPAHRLASERWTYFARAVLASDGDCADIRSLLTPRPDEVTCSEAGCWWYSTHLPIPTVSCEGDVAVLTTEGSTFRRDCSRAYLTCDPTSPTGCTDRPPSACSPGTVDRCDGTIKLGCDLYGRVTYHDCGWTESGRCVEDEGGASCAYETSTGCAFETALCDGASLRLCAAGKSVTVDCKSLGLDTCVAVGDLAVCR